MNFTSFGLCGLNNAMGNPVEYQTANPPDFSYTGDTGKVMGTFDGSLKLFNVGVKLGFVIRSKAEKRNSALTLLRKKWL